MESYALSLRDNHLAFLAAHRGEVRRDGAFVRLASDRPEFTYAIAGPEARIAQLPADVHTLQLLPSCSMSAEALAAEGFALAMGLSYMALADDAPAWRVRDDLAIAVVADAAAMDVFSAVQSHGFNEAPAAFAHWHPWLRAANQRNLARGDQSFYVAHAGAEAVGTALVVHSGAVAGIYAVATLASHRRQGVSTALLARAVGDARARGARVLTLQVKQDSDVESFYRRLGFQRVFTTPMLRRPQRRE